MHGLWALAGAIVLQVVLAPAALAQRELTEEEARTRIPHYDAMRQAAARGRELYLYDQAAWHATDRFREEFDFENASFMRGYVVVPRDDGRLDTVFYGEVDGRLVEVARYTVDGKRVEEGGLLPENARPPLSEIAMRMANARQTAAEEMRARKYALCANPPVNTLVLPPREDGSITVYILTQPTANDKYPMGGHYRFELGADGKVRDSRRFMNTCFDAAFGQAAGAPAGSTLSSIVLSHLLDPQPTEIHVFASYYLPVTLMVATTENRLMWSVRQGSIGYIGSLDELRRDGD